jgi:hypothetical protein
MFGVHRGRLGERYGIQWENRRDSLTFGMQRVSIACAIAERDRGGRRGRRERA